MDVARGGANMSHEANSVALAGLPACLRGRPPTRLPACPPACLPACPPARLPACRCTATCASSSPAALPQSTAQDSPASTACARRWLLTRLPRQCTAAGRHCRIAETINTPSTICRDKTALECTTDEDLSHLRAHLPTAHLSKPKAARQLESRARRARRTVPAALAGTDLSQASRVLGQPRLCWVGRGTSTSALAPMSVVAVCAGGARERCAIGVHLQIPQLWQRV